MEYEADASFSASPAMSRSGTYSIRSEDSPDELASSTPWDHDQLPPQPPSCPQAATWAEGADKNADAPNVIVHDERRSGNGAGEPTLIQRATGVGQQLFAMAEYMAMLVGWITMACIACAACYVALRAPPSEPIPYEEVSHWPLPNFSYPITEATTFGVRAALDDAGSELKRLKQQLGQTPMLKAYTMPIAHYVDGLASGVARTLEALSHLDQQPHTRLNEDLSFARAELLQVESQASAHAEQMAATVGKKPRPEGREGLLARGRRLSAALQRVQHARMQFTASSDAVVVVQDFRHLACRPKAPMPQNLEALSNLFRLDIKSILGASDMVCKAAKDVSDRESSVRRRTSLDESTRYSKRMDNLVERAEASTKFLGALEGEPVTPEDAMTMENRFAGIARGALTLIDEFYA